MIFLLSITAFILTHHQSSHYGTSFFFRYLDSKMSESAASSSRTHSSVWSHFEIIEEGLKAQCNYCRRVYYS